MTKLEYMLYSFQGFLTANLMIENQDFVFIPEEEPFIKPKKTDKVYYNFTGLPCPKKEVIEHIGEGGVEKIDQMVKEMIRWKVLLYGKNSHRIKFPVAIHFFDRNEPETCIECSPLVVYNGIKNYENLKNQYHFPERYTWLEQNYKMELAEQSNSIKNKISQIISGIM
ncbi:MAG: hypothetical protein HC831_21075 [Chloroflexia bacterium]|nr:hypothetical protein [Chloroflexia bacterium]